MVLWEGTSMWYMQKVSWQSYMFACGFGLEASVCRTLGKLIGMFHFPPDGYNPSILSTSSRGLELQGEGGEGEIARKKRKCFIIQCLKQPRLHGLGLCCEQERRETEKCRTTTGPTFRFSWMAESREGELLQVHPTPKCEFAAWSPCSAGNMAPSILWSLIMRPIWIVTPISRSAMGKEEAMCVWDGEWGGVEEEALELGGP